MSETQQDILTLPAMVTMPIGRWNQILEALGGQPWREVNTLIVDIHRQIEDAVKARSEPPKARPEPTGVTPAMLMTREPRT